MAKLCNVLTLAFITLLSVSTCPIFVESKTKPVAISARKEDIPFIKCGVCNQIVKQLSLQISSRRQKINPKQLSEYQIIEVAENICNLKKEEGDWLLHLDIVEDGNKLKLVEQEEEGECNTECKTIEKACQEVMGYHDTDVAEFLYKRDVEESALSKFLCNDLSNACSRKTPPVPKGRAPGEPFVPKPSKEAEMQKIMRSMSDMPGAPNMKMYSKDDILNMKNFGKGEDDDEDEDDEEDDIPSQGNKWKADRTGKRDIKKSITDRAQSFYHTVKSQTQVTFLKTKKSLQSLSDKLKRLYKEKATPKGKTEL